MKKKMAWIAPKWAQEVHSCTQAPRPNEDNMGQAELPIDGKEINERRTAVDGKVRNNKDSSESTAPPVVPAVIADDPPPDTASL